MRHKKQLLVAVVLCGCSSVADVAVAADAIEPSVVKLLVTKREPDYFRP